MVFLCGHNKNIGNKFKLFERGMYMKILFEKRSKFNQLLVVLLVTALLFTGCGKTSNEDEVVTLTWYLPGTTLPAQDEVMKVFNEKLSDKYGMRLELAFIDYGNFDTKMQVINAGREEYDLVYTSNWLNDYHKNVAMGSLLDITGLLDTHAPKLKASMPDYIWDAIKVDGKIYAAINWQIQAGASGLRMEKEYLDHLGVNYEQLKKIEDFEPIIKSYNEEKSKPANVPGLWKTLMASYGLADVVSNSCPAAIYCNEDGKPVVVNQYETPEYETYIRLRERWRKEGLTQSNLLTAEDIYKFEQKKNLLFNSNGTYKPGGDIEASQNLGYDVVQIQMSNPMVATGNLLATMTGVNAASKHPEKAVEFLEVINSDKELYNLLSFGIEGKNYKKISDTKIEVIDAQSYNVSNWMIGSVANSYITGKLPDTIWEDTKKYNEESSISPLLGFNVDTSSFVAELSNCANVLSEYSDILDQGLVNVDEKYPEFKKELKTAGVNKLVKELQKQIDKWYASK